MEVINFHPYYQKRPNKLKTNAWEKQESEAGVSTKREQNVGKERNRHFDGSFFLRFYFYIIETHRDRWLETQAEGEAGSMQGA